MTNRERNYNRRKKCNKGSKPIIIPYDDMGFGGLFSQLKKMIDDSNKKGRLRNRSFRFNMV